MRTTKKDEETTALAKSQKFEMRRLHRSELKAAPYNPRAMDGYARKKLKDNLSRVGLLMPLVWNEETGNLVAGHQRLVAMDAIEGGVDYELDVAVVKLSLRQEKEQNVFLNNPSVQGAFDLEALEKLVADVENFSWDKAGFELMEVESTFPELSRLFDPLKASDAKQKHIGETVAFADEVAEAKREKNALDREAAKGDEEALAEVEEEVDPEDKDGLEGLVARRKAYRDRQDMINSGAFVLNIVFPSQIHKEDFLRHIKQSPGAAYIDGVRLANQLGMEMTVGLDPKKDL